MRLQQLVEGRILASLEITHSVRKEGEMWTVLVGVERDAYVCVCMLLAKLAVLGAAGAHHVHACRPRPEQCRLHKLPVL